jgi:hypothetical protein
VSAVAPPFLTPLINTQSLDLRLSLELAQDTWQKHGLLMNLIKHQKDAFWDATYG